MSKILIILCSLSIKYLISVVVHHLFRLLKLKLCRSPVLCFRCMLYRTQFSRISHFPDFTTLLLVMIKDLDRHSSCWVSNILLSCQCLQSYFAFRFPFDKNNLSQYHAGCQLAIQAATTWCAVSAGGEFASTIGKINAISFAGWVVYFINSQMQGNKAGFAENGIKEGVAVTVFMAILNGLTFFA